MSTFEWPKNYYGCANSLPLDDKRLPKYIEQFKSNGFDDTETWSFYITTAQFILPRLKRYYEVAEKRIIITEEESKSIEASIKAFEILVNNDGNPSTKEEQEEVLNGLNHFAKVFTGLWW